jgi:hypothetical protein
MNDNKTGKKHFFLRCSHHGPFKTTIRKHIDSPHGDCLSCQSIGYNAYATDQEKARHSRVQQFLKRFLKDHSGDVDSLQPVREAETKTHSLNEALWRFALACKEREKELDNLLERVYTWFYGIQIPGREVHWWPQSGYVNTYQTAHQNAYSNTEYRNNREAVILIKFDIIREKETKSGRTSDTDW